MVAVQSECPYIHSFLLMQMFFCRVIIPTPLPSHNWFVCKIFAQGNTFLAIQQVFHSSTDIMSSTYDMGRFFCSGPTELAFTLLRPSSLDGASILTSFEPYNTRGHHESCTCHDKKFQTLQLLSTAAQIQTWCHVHSN